MSPDCLCTKMASGTPQARWRESTQSGRVSTIERMRFSPACGTHLVSRIACMARSRKVFSPEPLNGLSIAANHCGVARKITGALLRQLCGY